MTREFCDRCKLPACMVHRRPVGSGAWCRACYKMGLRREQRAKEAMP